MHRQIEKSAGSVRSKLHATLLACVIGLYLHLLNLSISLGRASVVISVEYAVMMSVMILGYLKFKRIVNPISSVMIFWLALIYYRLGISNRQNELTLQSQVYIYAFIFFYVLGTFFVLRRRLRPFVVHNEKSLYILNVLFAAAVIVACCEFYVFGGFPIVKSMFGGQDIYGEVVGIPIFHYLVMLSAILPAAYYYLYRIGAISKVSFYIFVIASLFIVLNTMSRQLLIFSIILSFFSYSSVNRIDPDRLLFKWAVFAIAAFILLGMSRISAINPNIQALDYLKAYSDVPKEFDVNIFDVTFNLYASLNFNTFQEMISLTNEVGYGKYFLKPIVGIINFGNVLGISYVEQYDSFRRLGTIVADPVLDFGLLGVIIFSFSYGLVSANIFRLLNSLRSIGVIIIWSTIVYTLLMSVFANFFNVFFSWICVFVGALISISTITLKLGAFFRTKNSIAH